MKAGAICALVGETDRNMAVRMMDAMRHRGHHHITELDGWQGWIGSMGEASTELHPLASTNEDTKITVNPDRIVAERGRLGFQPLYWAPIPRMPDGYVIATEVKAILAYPDLLRARQLDVEAFKLFLNMRYLPGDKTMFEGIHRVPSGCSATFAKGEQPAVEAVHHPSYVPGSPWSDDQIKATLEETVRPPPGPTGIYISGGLDSSVLTAMMAPKYAERGEEVKTFTMAFGGELDETADANVVAEAFSTNHRTLTVDPSFLRDYPKMIYYAEAPKRNLWTYYLNEMASKYVDHVLTGLGPDELFGGYTWKYNLCEQVERARQTPGINTVSMFAKHLIQYQAQYGDLEDDMHLDYLRKLAAVENDAMIYAQIQVQDEPVTRPIWGRTTDATPVDLSAAFRPYFAAVQGPERLLRGVMLADMWRKLPDDFNYVEGYMAAAHGMTLGCPILSDRMIMLGFSIPPRDKYSGEVGKLPWRRMAAKLLPPVLMQKRKAGFGTDAYTTFVEKIRDAAKETLPEGAAVRLGLVRKEYIDSLLAHPPTRKLVRQYCTVWNLWCFEVWWKIYMEGDEVKCPK